MIIHQTASIRLSLRRTSLLAIPRGFNSVKSAFIEGCADNKRVGTVSSIDTDSQISEIVLPFVELCDSFLVRYLRPCLDELCSKCHIHLVYFCTFEFVLRHCKGTWSMVSDCRDFFLK